MTAGLINLGFTIKSALLLLALTVVMLARIAGAQPLQATSIDYRPDLGTISPALDIYGFPAADKAPVIVYVHGGGWVTGDGSRVTDKPEHFARNGYLFVSVNYRLVPKVDVETQLEDIDAALGWIATNIADFGGDPDNITLLGHSAGAHLVSMAALAPLDNAQALIDTGALRGVIANDVRAYDIAKLAALSGTGKLPGVYALVFGDDPARWKRLSPETYIATGRPPFLVLYSGMGNADMRREISEGFAARLRAAGITATTFDGAAYTHGEMNKGIGTIPDLTAEIDAFLAQVTP